MRRAALLMLAMVLSGCSFLFDGNAPDLPLLGTPPSTAGLPRLNRTAADGARIIRGVDGAPWVAVREQGNVLRLIRLAEPPQQEELIAQQVHILYRSLYLLDSGLLPEQPTRLRIRAAGQVDKEQEFLLPPGDPLLIVGSTEDVFAFFPRRADARSFLIIRRDGSFSRTVPMPQGLDPQNPLAEGVVFFDGPGRYLFVRDGMGRLRAHSTLSEEDIDLGQRPRTLLSLDALRALLACGEDGLVRVPMDGGPDTVLDPQPCTPEGLRILGRAVYYLAQGELRTVPVDGSVPPTRAFPAPAQQVLAAGPAGMLVYSTDPPRRWASGASDGWLEGWRFMERGRQVSFSRDGTRLRWLEHAATLSGAGDLLSAELPEGVPLRLSRNVRQFVELTDGRLLCVAHHAFRGVHNRIVVIDEKARTARWVADHASGFLLIPGSNDLLAMLVKDNRGFDLVRLPIPPAEMQR
ncbi:MAG: hypothetical protein RMK29_04570 [Myxococcales bacterium]|nr:hypothetical protein [Myxococcota bacterium]MDW8280963.1 hypothetical protein [Myxococcales bacterium]